MFEKIRHWIRVKWLKILAILLAVGLFVYAVLQDTLAKVIAELTQPWWGVAWTWATNSPSIPLLYAAVLALILLITILNALREYRKHEEQREQLVELLNLVTTVWIATIEQALHGPNKKLEDIVAVFLRLSLPLFNGAAYRGAVFRADKQHHLKLWVAPLHTPVSKTRYFYIGNDPNRESDKNVHGTVFCDGDMRLAHFEHYREQGVNKERLMVTVVKTGWEPKKGTLWYPTPDEKTYNVRLPNDPTRGYESFVSIPVPDPDRPGQSYGILAFDGKRADDFNNAVSYEILWTLGTTLGHIIRAYGHLSIAGNNHPQGSPITPPLADSPPQSPKDPHNLTTPTT